MLYESGTTNILVYDRNRLRGLDSEWSKFDHSNWIAMSPLTLVDDRPPVIGLHIELLVVYYNKEYIEN